MTNLVSCSTFLVLFLAFNFAYSDPFLGVNYGQLADNLPPPSATAKLLQTTAFEKVRLYGTDPAIIKALANTGIGIVIGAANGDIPALSSDPSFAKTWINTNVIPYYPASNIILITVGNEVIDSNDTNLVNQMLPAIQNMQGALEAVSLAGKIKGLLSFNKDTGSPFAINPYPYFAYKSDPGRADNLAFCLFQPNAGRVDSNTKLNYMNMFDAQVDAVRSALDAMGFKEVEIVVAETGWPYKGDPDEAGPSIENAKAYNGNLITHLRSKVGTPLMPGKSVDTYIFALYDEDLKPGAASERAFGLYNPDQSMIYDAGLSKESSTPTSSPVAAPINPDVSKSPLNLTPKVSSPTLPYNSNIAWCVPKPGLTDVQLQANLDYACGQGIDCSSIQPGGACFEPNTLANHAAYAMNLFYHTGQNPLTCDFSQTATLTSNNPSYNSCVYAGGNA
ncbi:unnamed protein product [Vicia faba]|uniref:glucan endo-1,3-beta-D-glucosidase n=1 Tax=Vicia faba TaxID=3906 RepID=A0AAV1A896_VICFA|nr:unnamed protein product [Vicia faba]